MVKIRVMIISSSLGKNISKKFNSNTIHSTIMLLLSFSMLFGCQANPEGLGLLPNDRDHEQQVGKMISFEGISFTYPSSLAEGARGNNVPANVDTSGFLYDNMPEHLRFDFASSYITRKPFKVFQYNWVPWIKFEVPEHLDIGPQIFVLPITDYARINPMVSEKVKKLKCLLDQNFLPGGDAYPVLPTFNSTQDFSVQAIEIKFQNGRGLRFITRYSQETKPVINPQVFYSFQGLTDDNRLYIAAFFPLYISILPDQIEVDDWENFNQGYQDYLANITTRLEKLTPGDFEPDLYSMDALIESLSVR